MKIYLDDERVCPQGWTLCLWPIDVIRLLETNNVTHLSLDHDLGDDDKGTGYDVLLWIEYSIVLRGYTPPDNILIHTANPSARQKMEAALSNIRNLQWRE